MKRVSGVGRRHILKNFFKRINAPYDLRVRNAIDGEEMVHLALTKKSVYIILSSFLVGTFLIISLLFLYTPIKYYIPGFETTSSRKKLISLQAKIDSLESFQRQSARLFQNAFAATSSSLEQDTASLDMRSLESAEMKNVEEVETKNKRASRGSRAVDSNRKL